jgi:hypothetical protein
MNEIPNHVHNALTEWNTIAFFAYDSYSKKGRIVVGIEKDDNNSLGSSLMAIQYDQKDKPDQSVAQLISTYDPEMEIIIQFVDERGQIRTQRLRTAEGCFHPKRLYFFEILRRLEEEPETVNVNNLPSWLIQAIIKLDAAQKTKQE